MTHGTRWKLTPANLADTAARLLRETILIQMDERKAHCLHCIRIRGSALEKSMSKQPAYSFQWAAVPAVGLIDTDVGGGDE